VFEKIEDPRGLFEYKLGAALKMENTVLGMLGKLQDEAQGPELRQQLAHHAEETQQQIRNLEQAFDSLGLAPDENPCPAIEGIEKEGNATVKKADDRVVDTVILSGAAETEHHEIAVYEALIMMAAAMGHDDIVALLQENLEQEEHTLEEVMRATQQLAQRTMAQAA
jgi:ferritin-like metal-binding protein YciE